MLPISVILVKIKMCQHKKKVTVPLKMHVRHNSNTRVSSIATVCPRSLVHFDIKSRYIKMDKTSQTLNTTLV